MEELPYKNKLAGTYTKTVSFPNKAIKAHNQYQRKLGIGKASYEITYDLKYLRLTTEELSTVETFFGSQALGDIIRWKSPIDSFARNYRKPVTWGKTFYKKLVDGNWIYHVDLSFQLVLGNIVTPFWVVIPPDLTIGEHRNFLPLRGQRCFLDFRINLGLVIGDGVTMFDSLPLAATVDTMIIPPDVVQSASWWRTNLTTVLQIGQRGVEFDTGQWKMSFVGAETWASLSYNPNNFQ